MTEGTSYCFECKRPLVEIDNRGEHLTGCLTCNVWWSLLGGGALKLSVEDLHALQQLKRRLVQAIKQTAGGQAKTIAAIIKAAPA